jgi:hypothetical protein
MKLEDIYNPLIVKLGKSMMYKREMFQHQN